MKKQFKNFFCLLLALILPLSFSACKSKNDSKDGGGDGSGDQNTPVQTYFLTDNEVNRILTESFDSCETFVENLNNSNILKDGNYSESVGTKTDPVFDYIFYPAQFVEILNGAVETSKVYAYQNLEAGAKKYFEIFTNGTNNKIYVTILVDAYAKSELTTYAYEFNISEGNLDSLKLSYYFTDSTRLEFSESLLDFKNSECEIGMGDIIELPTSRSFVEYYFTKENFHSIDKTWWGSGTYYQNFKFGNQKNCYVNTSKMPNNADLIAQFDRFNFMDSYNKLDKYKATSNSDLTDLGKDYFSQLFANGHISFDSEDVIFKIKTED